jgi:hypothetical protein
MRHSRWPDPQGFIVKVNFSSSSLIANAPGSGPVPLPECARQFAARARTIHLRSCRAIAST